MGNCYFAYNIRVTTNTRGCAPRHLSPQWIRNFWWVFGGCKVFIDGKFLSKVTSNSTFIFLNYLALLGTDTSLCSWLAWIVYGLKSLWTCENWHFKEVLWVYDIICKTFGPQWENICKVHIDFGLRWTLDGYLNGWNLVYGAMTSYITS